MTSKQPEIVGGTAAERQNVDALWNTEDVASFLGVSVRTARRYVEQLGLPFIRLPKGVRYEPEAVREWAKGRTETKGAA